MLEVMENQIQAQKSVLTEGIISREANQIQGMIISARRFPRNEQLALDRIKKACEREDLAKSAMYEYPRGDQKVTGPSIRLAEVLAQSWGNFSCGVSELEQRNGESVCEAYAWDLETNTRDSKTFTVKHERSTKKGNYRLTDPRDVYELVANNGARRKRACILAIIPADVVDAAVEQCKATLNKQYSGDKKGDVIKKMIDSFQKECSVTKEMLEKYVGCKTEAFSPQDIIKLGNVFRSIQDGMAKPEDYFADIKPSSPSATSKLDEQFNLQSEER